MTDDQSARPELSLAKKASFAAISVVVALAALEGAARLVFAPPDARIHRDHDNMITVLGLPALNATMEFDPFLFWKLRDRLDAHPVVGEVRGTPMSFEVSTVDGLRSAAVRTDNPELRVLAIGDSCTFGLGVDDDATWPVRLEGMLRDKGIDAEVVNAGVPGYTAFQGLRFLESRGLALEPDVLVVTFGFNDRDLWSARSDLDTAQDLELAGWEKVAASSRLYSGFRRLVRSEGEAIPSPSEDPEAAREEIRRRTADAVPRLAPREFEDVLQAILLRAEERGIDVVFANWPYRSQVDQGIRQSVRYQTLMEKVGREAAIPVVDLAGPFIDRGGALFVDHVHASPEGNEVAASEILQAVAPD